MIRVIRETIKLKRSEMDMLVVPFDSCVCLTTGDRVGLKKEKKSRSRDRLESICAGWF